MQVNFTNGARRWGEGLAMLQTGTTILQDVELRKGADIVLQRYFDGATRHKCL